MSTDLGELKRTGSRNIILYVSSFYGGKNGICLQIGGTMEEGGYGYVQLNKNDMEKLIAIWQKNIGPLKIKEEVRTVQNKPVQQIQAEIAVLAKRLSFYCNEGYDNREIRDIHEKMLQLSIVK